MNKNERFVKTFIILLFISIIPVIQVKAKQITFSQEDIIHAAVFFADYVDFFNEPPDVLVIEENKINLAQAAYLFSKEISDEPAKLSLLNIKGYNDVSVNVPSAELSTEDLISVSKLYSGYLEKHKELPYLTKINNQLITNSDYIYITASLLREKYIKGKLPQAIMPKKLYFERTIKWNSKYAEGKNRHTVYTIDFESDRPIFASEFDKSTMSKQINSSSDYGLNPRYLKVICYSDTCTLPKDYNSTNYTSEEVAWNTAVLNIAGEVIYPECYPYCGALNGTDIFINDFIIRYNLPMVWHMTGGSIIALASKGNMTVEEIKKLNREGLLDLGMHTMYHSELKNISYEFLANTLKENKNLLLRIFNLAPVQFRSPYLSIAENNSHLFILNMLNISADNELEEIDSYCKGINNCNYEYNIASVKIAKQDYTISEQDNLVNIFVIHPWDMLFIAKGQPVHLEYSDDARINTIKNMMFVVGKYGLIPIAPSKIMKNEKE